MSWVIGELEICNWRGFAWIEIIEVWERQVRSKDSLVLAERERSLEESVSCHNYFVGNVVASFCFQQCLAYEYPGICFFLPINSHCPWA